MANKENILPHRFTHEKAVTAGRKGGIQKGINAKARKTLAEVLRAELDKDAGSGMTKQEYLVAKCLQTLGQGKVYPKDLKTLAEVLGELKMNLDLTSGGESGLLIKFDDTDNAQ